MGMQGPGLPPYVGPVNVMPHNDVAIAGTPLTYDVRVPLDEVSALRVEQAMTEIHVRACATVDHYAAMGAPLLGIGECTVTSAISDGALTIRARAFVFEQPLM
jgi:hypothetical protein